MLWQFLVNAILSASLCSIVALGFGLIYNTTRIFHFAHGAVFVVGSYVTYSLLIQLSWPLAAALGGGVLSGLTMGLLMNWAVYEPLLSTRSSPLVLMISSLGLYIVLIHAMAWVYGNEAKILLPGVAQTVSIASAKVTRVQLLQPAVLLVLFPLLAAVLKWTRLGRYVRALRDNPTLLGVMGHDARRLRYVVFALGSGLAAVGGMLSALDTGTDPQVGMGVLLTAAVAVIIGGVGVFEGAVVGAFCLALVQKLAACWIPSRWEDCLTFGALILLMTFRPQGLLGKKRRMEEH